MHHEETMCGYSYLVPAQAPAGRERPRSPRNVTTVRKAKLMFLSRVTLVYKLSSVRYRLVQTESGGSVDIVTCDKRFEVTGKYEGGAVSVALTAPLIDNITCSFRSCVYAASPWHQGHEGQALPVQG